MDPNGTGLGAWLVAMNDNCQGNTKAVALSRASDTSGTTLNWTFCNFSTAAPGGCGPGGGPVPLATGVRSGQNISQQTWAGDPVMASTRGAYGPNDIVALVNMATSNYPGTNIDDMIVVALSFDGGLTFSQTIYANQGHCNDGSQDQPAIAFDTSNFPPRLLVTWRYNAHPGQPDNSYGACTQFFDIDPNTHQVFGQPQLPQEVQNLNRQPFRGVGGLAIQGLNGRISIVYSNTDYVPGCPSSPIDVGFYHVSSDNGGLTWSQSVLIRDATTFAPCVANNSVAQSQRVFGFVQDSLYYHAAFPVSKTSIEVFSSSNKGNTWQLKKTISGGNIGSRFFVSLASDATDRVAASYYETDAQTDTGIIPMIDGATSVLNNVWNGETTTGPSFLTDPGCIPCRTLGDYAGIASKPRQSRLQKTYLPAWISFPPGRPSNGLEPRGTATRASVD
jgi:hypothetical protein